MQLVHVRLISDYWLIRFWFCLIGSLCIVSDVAVWVASRVRHCCEGTFSFFTCPARLSCTEFFELCYGMIPLCWMCSSLHWLSACSSSSSSSSSHTRGTCQACKTKTCLSRSACSLHFLFAIIITTELPNIPCTAVHFELVLLCGLSKASMSTSVSWTW